MAVTDEEESGLVCVKSEKCNEEVCVWVAWTWTQSCSGATQYYYVSVTDQL